MMTRKLITGLALVAATSVSYGTIYFQNDGTCEGWPNYPQQPEAQGTIYDTNNPAYQGPTAIQFSQTWQTNYTGRYHSEVDYQNTQGVGQDMYYGMTVYLPNNWVYTNSNVCIQQWAGASPWLMMEIRGNQIEVLPHITGIQDLGTIPTGQWVRIVTHLNTSSVNGEFQVWVNGVQEMNLTGNFSPTNAGSTEVRWSAGAYVTGWYGVTTQPTPSFIRLFQDHYCMASTEAEADPANWDEVYELQNASSGLALNVAGGASSNGTEIVQWPFSGSSNSLWTFIPTTNGYYQINNVQTVKDAVVQSASTANGAKIIQWTFGSSGDDQWEPVQATSNTWNFVDLKSGKLLEDPGSSPTNGTQMDQWSSTGGANQQWELDLQ